MTFPTRLGSLGGRQAVTSLRALAAIVVLTGCVMPAFQRGHSAARLDCLQACAGAKDRCLLDARTASDVQQCDVNASACVGACPP